MDKIIEFIHISQVVGLFIGISFVSCLIVYLAYRYFKEFIEKHDNTSS
jgi:hypothetical protein